MIASAYLRIFQPLDALPEAERSRWERFIVQGTAKASARPAYRQLRTAGGGRLGVLVAEEDRADVRLVEDRWYVCPWRTRLRVLAGLLSLRDSMPQEVADALVPEEEARRAGRELARIRKRDPGQVPTMLQSPWHVPVRWFVLVDEPERRLVEREEGGYRLYYSAALADAKRRAERTWRVLDKRELEPIGDLVRDLAGWVSVFPRDSFVELDYASVSDLFSWNELDDDHSAREIHEAVDAVEAGDMDRATELYQQVAGRWAEARIRESLN